MSNRDLRCIAFVLACQSLLVPAGFAQSASSSAKHASIASLQKEAEAGDAEAQTKLGIAYRDGIGVRTDDDKAVTWLRKAAEQGNPAAENALGVQYHTGRGVPKDLEQAFQWYKKSAAQKFVPG